MVKRRPAVVVSPRFHSRHNLCTVVPLSTTPPAHNEDYIVELNFNEPVSQQYSAVRMWAKCDFVGTVDLKRLDFFRAGRRPDGKRAYSKPLLDEDQFNAIQRGIMHALGMGN